MNIRKQKDGFHQEFQQHARLFKSLVLEESTAATGANGLKIQLPKAS